jgi:hypothetical protein
VPDLHELAAAYQTDKGSWPGYLEVYERFLAPLLDRPGPVALLELGVRHGGSLQLWRDHLPAGPVVGLDLDLPAVDDPSGRIRMYQGSQDDEALLRRIAATEAPDGFDVVIDDCAHQGALALASFRVLYPLLRPGGCYFVEDWGAGYWPDWIDGARLRSPGAGRLGRIGGRWERPLHRWSTSSHLPAPARGALRRARGLQQRAAWRQHQAGMVGFVKLLVDEVGGRDVAQGGSTPPLGVAIDELVIRPGVVVVRKPLR